MGNQVNGLGLVGKALIEQFTLLEVKSMGENSQDVERFHFTKLHMFKIKEQNHKHSADCGERLFQAGQELTDEGLKGPSPLGIITNI